jgi:putative membrane protein
MMSSSRRLHHWSILFLAGDTLKGMLLPILALMFTANRSRWDLLLVWLSVPAAVISAWRYFTTWYELADDELVIRTGLLSRNVRHVRYARVHNVETVQNPLHRLLRVAEVRVETAGASEEEAKLRVLSLADADEVRRRVIEGKRRAKETTDAPVALEGVEPSPLEERGAAAGDAHELVRLRLRDLLAFGLTQNRGGIVIGAILGLLWEADFANIDLGRPTLIVGRFFTRLWDDGRLLDNPGMTQVWLVLAGLFAVLVFVRVLSVLWAIVQLHGFTLTRHGDELRSTRGLLTRVRSTIPLARIQLVTVRQSPLMRAFGRVEVRVQTAGGDKHATPGREWLAPSLPATGVDALVASVFPGVVMSSLEWQSADPRTARRMWRAAVGWLAVVLLIGMVFARVPTLALMLPAIAFAWFASRGRARSFGHVLLPEFVATRAGWWWKEESVARYAKLQSVSTAESPFDRRWSMADVLADTAGGGAHRIAIHCLPVDEARAVYSHLCEQAASTTFRW